MDPAIFEIVASPLYRFWYYDPLAPVPPGYVPDPEDIDDEGQVEYF